MDSGHTIWRTGPNHLLTAEINGFRLVVRGPDHAGGPAVFHVIQNATGGHRALAGSGTGPDVRAAMLAAEQMAERLAR